MEWKNFKESEREYPEKVVNESISGFHISTNKLVEMQVSELSDSSRINSSLYTNFQFRLRLKSEYVSSYSFDIFTFGYNIELAPIKIILEYSIFEEIKGRTMINNNERINILDEVELKEFLSQVFQTKRFNEIVMGLMKIARKNKDKEFDL